MMGLKRTCLDEIFWDQSHFLRKEDRARIGSIRSVGNPVVLIISSDHPEKIKARAEAWAPPMANSYALTIDLTTRLEPEGRDRPNDVSLYEFYAVAVQYYHIDQVGSSP